MSHSQKSTIRARRSARRRKTGLWILLGGGVLLGGLMALLVVVSGGAAGRDSRAPTPVPDRAAVGQPAPDFTAFTPDNQEISLSGLRGSPVAVNFWATWCGPCRVEMPVLQRAIERYAEEGLVILAVNGGESAGIVQAYMDALGLTFSALLDPNGAIVEQYGIQAFPTTIWIDRQGIIQAKHLGPLSSDLIDSYMADLLGTPTPSP